MLIFWGQRRICDRRVDLCFTLTEPDPPYSARPYSTTGRFGRIPLLCLSRLPWIHESCNRMAGHCSRAGRDRRFKKGTVTVPEITTDCSFRYYGQKWKAASELVQLQADKGSAPTGSGRFGWFFPHDVGPVMYKALKISCYTGDLEQLGHFAGWNPAMLTHFLALITFDLYILEDSGLFLPRQNDLLNKHSAKTTQSGTRILHNSISEMASELVLQRL